eukprot:TRINITY_DN9594_c0_g1_i1.p1 TRINITY_DN9594_c0_g1~~TRINITY_DN9594_c0_g1_i1.p1  ORF type:complete len:255 (-),score=58.43 TRINITY_DN9594_c0_g1_i1:101-865(-)
MNIIQDTWDESEDEELIDFMTSVAPQDLLTWSSDHILDTVPSSVPYHHVHALFADTSIVQQVLKGKYEVPDTYPNYFNSIYRRKIEKLPFKEIIDMEYPYFVKPVKNAKEFDALVVRNQLEFEYIESLMEDDPENQLYVCDVVKFLNEFRLFIGQDPDSNTPKIYGCVNATTFVMEDGTSDQHPPQNFLDDILTLNNVPFSVVDVAILDTGDWAVVEVNPPFALSSYDWPIEKYYNYCRDAWQFIVANIDTELY